MIHAKFTKNSQAALRVINWNIKWLKNPNTQKMSKSLKTINKKNSNKRSPNSAAKSSQDGIFTTPRSQNNWQSQSHVKGKTWVHVPSRSSGTSQKRVVIQFGFYDKDYHYNNTTISILYPDGTNSSHLRTNLTRVLCLVCRYALYWTSIPHVRSSASKTHFWITVQKNQGSSLFKNYQLSLLF